MDLKITLEWDADLGFPLSKMYSINESIEQQFSKKNYGQSVSSIGIVLVCRQLDFAQRKRYLKALKRIELDVLLEYSLIKNLTPAEKEDFIRIQLVQGVIAALSRNKFDDFQVNAFLTDFKRAASSSSSALPEK